MNLIHFRGLNCYYNCIVSTASFMGINYPSAFATLWSETDFTYDSRHKLYLTRRMVSNLKKMGAGIEILDCSSPKETAESLFSFDPGEWIMIGIDGFYIPWNECYQTLHGTHYFLAKKETNDTLSCFDPTYNQKNMPAMVGDMIPYIFDILRLHNVAEIPFHTDVVQESKAVLSSHLQMRTAMLTKLSDCSGPEKQNSGLLLARYIDALINNRYLYRHYLQKTPDMPPIILPFFDDAYFLQWTTVKNGLFKASLMGNNKVLLTEVCRQFNTLIDSEIEIATKVLGLHSH